MQFFCNYCHSRCVSEWGIGSDVFGFRGLHGRLERNEMKISSWFPRVCLSWNAVGQTLENLSVRSVNKTTIRDSIKMVIPCTKHHVTTI